MRLSSKTELRFSTHSVLTFPSNQIQNRVLSAGYDWPTLLVLGSAPANLTEHGNKGAVFELERVRVVHPKKCFFGEHARVQFKQNDAMPHFVQNCFQSQNQLRFSSCRRANHGDSDSLVEKHVQLLQLLHYSILPEKRT